MATSSQSIRPITGAQVARFNPFAMQHVESISFRFPSGDWESQLRKLREQHWRGAIVGPHGSGKTTLLLELRQQLTGLQEPFEYCFLARERAKRSAELDRLFRMAEKGHLLLIDGIERLSWWQRRRLFRHANRRSRIVVTAHRSCGLPVWIESETNWPLMKNILLELVSEPNSRLLATGERLFASHRGNVRDTLRELYDHWSDGGFSLPPVSCRGRT